MPSCANLGKCLTLLTCTMGIKVAPLRPPSDKLRTVRATAGLALCHHCHDTCVPLNNWTVCPGSLRSFPGTAGFSDLLMLRIRTVLRRVLESFSSFLFPLLGWGPSSLCIKHQTSFPGKLSSPGRAAVGEATPERSEAHRGQGTYPRTRS